MSNSNSLQRPRAVILAAGIGGRLGDRTANVPKPLVEVAGRSLIGHTISGLAGAGITDAVVVTGYRAPELRDHLVRDTRVRLQFAHNPDYQLGASYSLRAARSAVTDEPFLLVMADHMLSSDLIARLLQSAAESSALAVVAADLGSTWDAEYLAEATRLEVLPGGAVRQIGKLIEPWTAIDAGAFFLRPAAWQIIDEAPADCDLSTIFGMMATRGALAAADITGASWYDVDTEDDLLAAEAKLLAG